VVGGLFENKIHIGFMGGFTGVAYEGDDYQTIGESVWSDIFDLYREFHCHRAYLEANYKAAASACRRYIAKTDAHMVVEEFTVQGAKKTRIPSLLEQPINNGMVSMNPDILQDGNNRHQLMKLRWSKLPNPNDRIDALASLISILIDEPVLMSAHAGPDQLGLKQLDQLKLQSGDNRPYSWNGVNTRNPYLRIKH